MGDAAGRRAAKPPGAPRRRGRRFEPHRARRGGRRPPLAAATPRRGREPFDAVVGLLYEAARDPARWPDALTAASDHAGAIGGLVTRYRAASARSWIEVGRLDPDLTTLYCERYAWNPYSARILHEAPGVPRLANTLADPSIVRRTAFHADILAPQAIEDHIMMSYAPWAGAPAGGARADSGGVAVVLGARAAGSPGRAMAVLNRLAPHVTRALDLAAAIGSGAHLRRTLAETIHAAPGAMLLLNPDGRITAANAAAEAILRAGDGLRAGGRLDSRRPDAALPGEAWALARLVARAATAAAAAASGGTDGEGAAGGRLRVTRPSGRPAYALLVSPLPPAPPPWDRGEEPAVVVAVADPAAAPAAEPAALAAAFGLTPAEARVAALVARGEGLAAAAAALGVRLATARTQLAAVFSKLGVRSQAQVALAVAALPRGRPAPGAAEGGGGG